MEPAADIMHGEAVNVDGFLCLVIAKRRGMISEAVLERVFRVMKNIGLPTIHKGVELALMVKVRYTNKRRNNSSLGHAVRAPSTCAFLRQQSMQHGTPCPLSSTQLGPIFPALRTDTSVCVLNFYNEHFGGRQA